MREPPRQFIFYVVFWATFNFLKWLVGGVDTWERTITSSLFLSYLRLEFVAYSFCAQASSYVLEFGNVIHSLYDKYTVFKYTLFKYRCLRNPGTKLPMFFAINRRLSNLHSHCKKVALGGKVCGSGRTTPFTFPLARGEEFSKELKETRRLEAAVWKGRSLAVYLSINQGHGSSKKESF